MRQTYSMLLQTAKDMAIDPSTTSTTSLSSTEAILALNTNLTVDFLFQKLRNYKTQPTPRTMSTVADQVYYHYPPHLMSIESITMTVGDINYPLKPIHSQETWDHYQQLDITSSDVPQYYFPRQSDFGIFPTPAGIYTVTVVSNYLPKRMTVSDYSTGTITLTNNSRTVTGSGTTFSQAMVGRWLVETNGSLPTGNWYKISGFTSTTELTLESYYEDTTVSGATYIIGESPEIPEEMHQFIPFNAAAMFYATSRRDPEQAQALLNYFYTGDFSNPRRGGGITGGVQGIINRYNNLGRANSQINHLHKQTYDHWRDERWSATLSEA